LPQVTAAQELQIKAEARLASLIEEKLVTRISVLSTFLGGGKTTERLLVRISIETHKTSPDFDQTAADKAKNRIKQARHDAALIEAFKAVEWTCPNRESYFRVGPE
jgi:16S rRNA C1402 N4-methylase RsmH